MHVLTRLALAIFLLAQALPAADPIDVQASRAAAWKLLDEALQRGSETRQEALAAIGTIGSPDDGAVQRALAALHNKDHFVRRAAALTLGNLKAKSAIPDLQRALDDTPEVSFAAAKALTQLGDASGRDILMAVLSGERKDAPGLFANALREAKNKLHHPEGLILMGTEDAAGAMFGPASMIIPAVKDTSELMGKGAPGRAAAVAYLAKYPDDYAITLLEWALADDSHMVRLEAARALGERGNAGSIQKLQGLWLDKHTIVRDMGAAAIIRILARNGEAGEVSDMPMSPPPAHKK